MNIYHIMYRGSFTNENNRINIAHENNFT